MKTIRLTYFALLTLVSASSCSREDAGEVVTDWTEKDIYFRTSLSDITSSRGHNMTFDGLESFQVTCFTTDGQSTSTISKDDDGYVLPYFENGTFIRHANQSGIVTYVSSPDEPMRYWPVTDGTFKFFAFSPSLWSMASQNYLENTSESNYFKLINRSTAVNSTIMVDYRLANFRVNPDISRQVDFITAQASGGRYADFASGVDLAFRHQLSQVELRAWGTGEKYDIEIAGVRLGNPAIEGTYIFSDASATSGPDAWHNEKATGKVEYTYRGSDASDSRDKIFLINNTHHNTQQTAQTLMGSGGCAMVLPTVNPRWEGLADPNIGVRPYSTPKMYFSILLRVTPRGGGQTLYPYPGKPDGMTVIYYAVDGSDTIISRVYPGPTGDTYFTDSALQNPYIAAEGEKIKEFGWAAVPVDSDWSSGQRYVYTLNYSEGLGLHDPEDPEPGKPIVFSSPVSWSVSVDTWHEAEKNDDFEPDVNVP